MARGGSRGRGCQSSPLSPPSAPAGSSSDSGRRLRGTSIAPRSVPRRPRSRSAPLSDNRRGCGTGKRQGAGGGIQDQGPESWRNGIHIVRSVGHDWRTADPWRAARPLPCSSRRSRLLKLRSPNGFSAEDLWRLPKTSLPSPGVDGDCSCRNRFSFFTNHAEEHALAALIGAEVGRHDGKDKSRVERLISDERACRQDLLDALTGPSSRRSRSTSLPSQAVLPGIGPKEEKPRIPIAVES